MKQCQKCGNTFDDLERDSEDEVNAIYSKTGRPSVLYQIRCLRSYGVVVQ